MAMMKNFDKEFVERTLEILSDCSNETDYEVTLLINCLLALVTLPIERNKVTKKKTNDSKIVLFQKDCINAIDKLKNPSNYINTNQDCFFNNIRNAIAHLHIEVEESSCKGKIENIVLKNAPNKADYRKKNYDLQISISVINLKKFAEYVASEYLKRFF